MSPERGKVGGKTNALFPAQDAPVTLTFRTPSGPSVVPVGASADAAVSFSDPRAGAPLPAPALDDMLGVR